MKWIALFFLFALSCTSGPYNSSSAIDSTLSKEQTDAIIDSFHKSSALRLIDTAGLYLAPVKILKAKFVEQEYSSYKNVWLSYKNVSSKKIEAIRFRWYATNAFDEPAEVGGMIDGLGGGFADEVLKPNSTSSGEFDVLSKDGKNIILAWPYEVAFSDGTKWKIN